METQTVPTLRPLRLGELLDQAIRLYRRNFTTFIGIIALVYVPLMILQTASSAILTSSMDALSFSNSPGEIFSSYAYWIGILSTLVVSFLQFIFVQGIATGALTRAVADNYLGKPTSILDAYRGIGKSWPSLLGALLLIGLLILVVAIWWLVPCIGWFTGLGMLVFLSAAVSPMVAPVVVLEEARAGSAVQRAWYLVRRRFWPVLGTIFVLYLFNLLIVNGPLAVVNYLLSTTLPGVFGDFNTRLVVTAIIQAIVSIVFVLIYYPLQMTAFTLVYFDLRVRTEGFDLALLTMDSQFAENSLQVTAASVPQTSEKLITGSDLGNFAILTFGALGLYILIFSVLFGGMFFLTSLF